MSQKIRKNDKKSIQKQTTLTHAHTQTHTYRQAKTNEVSKLSPNK